MKVGKYMLELHCDHPRCSWIIVISYFIAINILVAPPRDTKLRATQKSRDKFALLSNKLSLFSIYIVVFVI